MAASYDAIVIGAGVIGSAIGLELARKGLKTVNVDALPAAGYGSTSASAACIRVYYSTRDGAAFAYEGLHYWRHWAEHLGLPPEGLARYREIGSVVTKTKGNGGLVAICENMTALGIRFEEWDAARFVAELPFMDPQRFDPPRRPDDPQFGESDGILEGAVFFPDAGYVDDPQLAARNLQQAAEKNGGAFRFNSKIIAIRRSGGRVQGVTLADGSEIDAPIVVNVAGPHSSIVNRMAGVEGEMGVRTCAMQQEVAYVPGPPGLDHEGRGLLMADADVGCYWRSQSGNGLLIGGLEPACDPMHWVEDPDAWTGEFTEQYDAQLYRAALRMPSLPIPNQASGIVALYDVSDDWIPIYDRTSLAGYYMAVGTSGNQFKNAPLVGVLMAELITACEAGHDHDRDPIRIKGRYTGLELDLGFASRLRKVHKDSSFSVLG